MNKKPGWMEDGLPVKQLSFRGSVDIPGEQQVMRITSAPRLDRPKYEIMFFPRVRMYHVAMFPPLAGGGHAAAPSGSLLIPADWALGEIDP